MISRDGLPDLRTALHLHQAGQLDRAAEIYREILVRHPDNAEVLHYLGLLEAREGKFERANSLIVRSLELQPSNTQFRENYATILYEARRYQLAVELCEEGLRSNPANISLLYIGALALLKLDRLPESLQRFDKLLAIRPNHLVAINERGSVLAKMGEHEKALAAFQEVVSVNAKFADAHLNMGSLLGNLGRHEEAKLAFKTALGLNPRLAHAWSGLGNILRGHNLFEEALASFDKALALEPDVVAAWLGRGTALYKLKRFDDALASYDRALALVPDLAEAWLGRASALNVLGRHPEAASSFLSLLKIKPDYPFAKGMLLYQKMMVCDWSAIGELINEIERDLDLGRPSAEPLGWQAASRSPQSLLRCAELFNAARFPVEFKGTVASPPEHNKIRIGYLGDVFREQAVSYLLVGVLELADKSRFELYGFDNGWNDKSATRQRVEAALTEVIDIRSYDDTSAAAIIRQREIDILVNLNVYFGDHRSGVFAKRPAPIQVNYLGFPGTMGASYLNYIIADYWVIPEDDRDCYAEKVVYLPGCYQPNDRKKEIASHEFSRAECGLPENGFVFCCFNNSFKITPDVFDRWMRILRKTDGSVLWLAEDKLSLSANLRGEAKARGVDPERLKFAKRNLPLAEHLARHRLADLFLDTLPFNAHTTASDALWAGLPVLTQVGSTFPGRVAASLLNAVGLPELITSSPQAYEDLALELADNSQKLAAIKHKLAKDRLATPLFDTELYARRLDAAYAVMYERHRAGLPPDHIDMHTEV